MVQLRLLYMVQHGSFRACKVLKRQPHRYIHSRKVPPYLLALELNRTRKVKQNQCYSRMVQQSLCRNRMVQQRPLIGHLRQEHRHVTMQANRKCLN